MTNIYKLVIRYILMGEKEPIFSLNRAKIVMELKNNPLTITELQKAISIPRATLIHHLAYLKKKGLIYDKKISGKCGNPVVWTLTDKATPISKAELEIYEKIYSLFKGKK